MNRLFTMLTLTFYCSILFSQAPEKISYQAVIRNSNDQLVKNASVGIQISILQGSATGTEVYVERHLPTTNINGLVSLEIGTGTVIQGVFRNIGWDKGVYFLKTETDLTGGSNYTISGTTQLISVPYALYAKTAGNFMEMDPLWKSDSVNYYTRTEVDSLLQKIDYLENQPGIIRDNNGNLYTTVKIGNQIWMSENLKTAWYSNGRKIPYVTDVNVWAGGGPYSAENDSGAYCWNLNNESFFKEPYGALYNYSAVIYEHNVCPLGWHVPSKDEWMEMINFAGGINQAATKLKEPGTVHWVEPNSGGTDETGFSARGGSWRNYDGTFWGEIGDAGYFWTSTKYSQTEAWNITIRRNVLVSHSKLTSGYSIRCVKD